MKIAYLVPYLERSGPVNVVRYLCEYLMEKHEIDLFYFKDIVAVDFPVPSRRISFFESLEFDKYDVIHSHGVLPDAYLFWHKKKIHSAKTVTTLHNYVKEDFKYAYTPIKAFLLEKIWNIATSRHDQVVTLSNDAVKYYRLFWFNKNLTYVYNGIPEIENSGSKSERQAQEKYVKIGGIGSGNISMVKGFDQVIRALAKLPNHTFYIAGGGHQVEVLRRLALSCGVESRVFFVGFQKDIASFINKMDLFVVSSRSEGFPLAMLEIVRGKKPIVCSKIPIFEELFDNTEVVFFDLDNTESLTEAIEKLSQNNKDYVCNAYQRFIGTYTSKRMALGYVEIYKRLMGKENGVVL